MRQYLNLTVRKLNFGPEGEKNRVANAVTAAYINTNCTPNAVNKLVFENYLSLNLCKPFVFLPPYTCTRSENIRINSFISAVGLASSNAFLVMSLFAIPASILVERMDLVWRKHNFEEDDNNTINQYNKMLGPLKTSHRSQQGIYSSSATLADAEGKVKPPYADL